MQFGIFLGYYLLWHYSLALFEIGKIARNFAIFLYQVFSLPKLISNFSSPLPSISRTYRSHFDDADVVASVVLNGFSRALGVLLRLVVIGVSSVLILILLLGMLLMSLIWILLPLVIPILFFGGLYMIFT